MVQLKKALAAMAKHRFWIIIGFAMLLGAVAWFSTSSALSDNFDSSKRAIDEKFTAMKTVSGAIGKHPNDDSKEQMTLIINALAKDVESAWKEQYSRQEQYLKWREDAVGLGILISKLKRFYPVELKLKYPDEPDNPKVTDEEKRRFSQYFAEQMPELSKIIGVKWVGEAGAPGAAGVGFGSPVSEGPDDMSSESIAVSPLGRGARSTDVVVWPKTSQSELLTSLRLWKGDTPTVFQMMYTQENMWILEGIFNIIRKTNVLPETGQNATANFQASVKSIEFIRIGRDAVTESGVITPIGKPVQDSTGSSESYEGGDYSSDSSDSSGSMAMSDVGSSGSGAADMAAGVANKDPFIDPADKRYVDANFKPISGDDLRSKITSDSPESAYFTVAKRVPVRMKLVISLPRLQTFLANCGNEGLMLEVRQVRLGKFPQGSSGGAGFGTGSVGMFGMGMEDPSMMSGPDMGDMGASFGGPGGMAPRTKRKNNNDLPVEVYGVVYLFNPANTAKLGLDKVNEDTQLKNTVDTPTDQSAPTDASSAQPSGDATPAPVAPDSPAPNLGGADSSTTNPAPSGTTVEGTATAP